jgi:zinc transporter 1/2/3
MDADGNDVLIQEEETTTSSETVSDHDDSESGHEESSSETKTNCHFHAGVESVYKSHFL